MGFRDASMALVHYAQKAAIAQRRTVCVHFSSTEAWLTIRSAADDTACGVHATPASPLPAGEVGLTGPDGKTPFQVLAVSGISYSPVPAGFYFAASGRPSAGGSIVVGGSGGGSITVEADTGHVHKP